MTSMRKPSKTSHLLDPVETPVSPARSKGAPADAVRPQSASDAAASAAAAVPGQELAAGYIHPAALNGDGNGVVKHFVIDTNVLLHNPNALFVFKEHHVVIPFAVIEELDAMKRKDDDLGRNARECIRHLDRLRSRGRLTDGVAWGQYSPTVGAAASVGSQGQTGTIRIDTVEHERPGAIDNDTPDNRIIAAAWALHKAGTVTVFISKDISARIKSDALGIPTEDFENQKVDADHLYNGFISAEVETEIIDELYRDRMLPLERLAPALAATTADGQPYQRELTANQFIVLRDVTDEAHSGLGRRLADTDHIIPVTGPRKPVFGIMARNVQQTMALDLLLDDEIKFLTLLGSAGTGKTLLAIAAGMAKVFSEERYEKLLVARPIMPLGRDIGYLPGDKDEKLTAWMQPIFDNLTYLLSTRGSHMQSAESHSTEQRINKLMADGKLVLEPLTYIRGRSIPHQFIIVDEAQNLTPHEVKTIVSRVGEGTKIVLTGDIGQIDNPYLDQSSNGLAFAVEKMKGLGLVGHVTLAKSERSELASLAAARL
jgi:PhoH-like ATPase